MKQWFVYFRGNKEAGPFDTEAQAESARMRKVELKIDNMTWDNTYVDSEESPTSESYEPFQLLREMISITEADRGKKKKSLKKAAKSVYHRDYMKTRNKSYRKYDPEQYQHNKED